MYVRFGFALDLGWNNTDALQWNFQRNVAELHSGFHKIYSYESKEKKTIQDSSFK